MMKASFSGDQRIVRAKPYGALAKLGQEPCKIIEVVTIETAWRIEQFAPCTLQSALKKAWLLIGGPAWMAVSLTCAGPWIAALSVPLQSLKHFGQGLASGFRVYWL